jgi:hypothetical protein
MYPVPFLRRTSLILSRRAHKCAVSVKSILNWKKIMFPVLAIVYLLWAPVRGATSSNYFITATVQLPLRADPCTSVVQCSSPSPCGNFSDTWVMHVESYAGANTAVWCRLAKEMFVWRSWQTGGALAAAVTTYIRIKYTTAMNYAYAN